MHTEVYKKYKENNPLNMAIREFTALQRKNEKIVSKLYHRVKENGYYCLYAILNIGLESSTRFYVQLSDSCPVLY